MTKEEIEGQIRADLNVLEQHDYTGRRIAWEFARLFKQAHPEIPTPIFDQYIENEEKAELLRQEIRELREKLENGEYDQSEQQ